MSPVQEISQSFALELTTCVEWRNYDRLLPLWYVLMVQYGVNFPDAITLTNSGDVSISQKRTTKNGEQFVREFVCDNCNLLLGCRLVNGKFEVMDKVFSLALALHRPDRLRVDGTLTPEQTLTLPEHIRATLPFDGGCPQLLHTDL